MASDADHGPDLPLLTAADPPPFTVLNPAGSSPFLFIGDHAGNVIPSRLGSLGLTEADLIRHIAWDIGIDGLGAKLAEALDATFLRQTYSRLVIDCNRRPDAVDAIAPVSDGTPVPGNADLSSPARSARIAEIHEVYHQAIGAEIDRRASAGITSILIALHSFTPALAGGASRPWHVGVLCDRGESAFARTLLDQLRRDRSLMVGDNEPYRMDTTDYTIPRHCYSARLPYAELEIRQDLIGAIEGQRRWAKLFADTLPRVRTSLARAGE